MQHAGEQPGDVFAQSMTATTSDRIVSCGLVPGDELAIQRAWYGRVAETVNRLRLRPMAELGKTKGNGIAAAC